MRNRQTRPAHAPLKHSFYAHSVDEVARDLLGKLLVCDHGDGFVSGRIVETEAYLSEGDDACHASRGRKRRNATMFGPPGRAYVYSIHARYCLNAVTEAVDRPSAVLIRAIEPLAGIDVMQRRRGTDKLRDLARGPARLCQALSIDRELDGHDLSLGERLWISADGAEDIDSSTIVATPRIGVTSAKELLLRFAVADNRFVSGSRRLNAAR